MPENQDNSLYKIPPQNIDAEESVLSAVLTDNTYLLDIIEILSPEDFYKPSHQKIFSAIMDLFSRDEPVDLVTLANILKVRKKLEEIGGAAYLTKLVDTAPMAVNAAHYAKIVHDKACLRRLIEKSNAITQLCFEDSDDVDEIVDFAESSIYEIAENKTKPGFFHIGKIVSQNIDTLEERQGNKALITGIGTGFTQLDTITAGLQNSDLIILAARPSMGKTALALNLARNMAIDEQVPVAFFSLEMSKEQLSMRMLCSEARVNSSHVRSGFFSKEDWFKLTEAAGILSQAPIYIDDSPDISAVSIRAKTRRLKMDKEIGAIFIDYMQLMKTNSRAERRDLEISELSRSLKSLAKEVNIPVIALSQLNRRLEERSDKRPMLSDLRESGALEQDADVVAFIFREEVYLKSEAALDKKGKAELIIAKQRNGPVGTVPLTFIDSYTRFESYAEDINPDIK